MKKINKKNFAGFTLIELLVVIVIIGILATISVSTFNNYQSKARDAKRISDFKQTVDLIKQYTIVNEKLPTLTGTTSPLVCAGWRVASKTYKEEIIELGTKFKYKFSENYWEDCVGFAFFVYSPGSGGCPAEKGRLLIFATALEQIDNGDKTLEDLGLSEYKFSCSGRNWVEKNGRDNRNMVFGIFENGDTGSQP